MKPGLVFRSTSRSLAVGIGLLMVCSNAAAQPSFTWLDASVDPFWDPPTRPVAATNDGSLIIGNGFSNWGPDSWKWTAASGLESILDRNAYSISNLSVTGVSPDGLYIAGWADNQAFRFDAGGRLNLLPFRAVASQSLLVTLDGHVIGTTHTGAAYRAFRWSSGSAPESIEPPTGFDGTLASGVSADGSTIVGLTFNNSGTVRAAFIWTRAGGTVVIDLPAGLTPGNPLSVSTDGATVICAAYEVGTAHLFRWSHEDGLTKLGTTSYSITAASVTSDRILASHVVGDPPWTFLWSPSGWQSFPAWLRDGYGLDGAGDSLRRVWVVSEDGLTFAGVGLHPNDQQRGWIARIAPVPCLGDFDGDGIRNQRDLALLLSNFGERVDPYADGDSNGDGIVDGGDLAFAIRMYGRDCPQ